MSLPSEDSTAPAGALCKPSHPEIAEFTPQERKALLSLARESIASALQSRHFDAFPASPHFEELRGAFTTLYVNDELRGCVGYALPVAPLYRAIVETARAAAFDDARFWPLKAEELPHLRISLSVLSPLKFIRPDDVEVGKHGLLLSLGDHHGLLLPQVPVEHGWDRITFLQQTCRKAGLSPDSWHPPAKLEAFTTEGFDDRETP